MTDMEIRDRLKAIEVRAENREVQLNKIEAHVAELVADLHERRGREAAMRLHHVEDREDSWQLSTWIRSLLPPVIASGVWVAVWKYFTGAPQ